MEFGLGGWSRSEQDCSAVSLQSNLDLFGGVSADSPDSCPVSGNGCQPLPLAQQAEGV